MVTELARRGYTAVHYDRPGRGESGGQPPFTLAGELMAISALITEIGAPTTLYGSSSGGAIALAAAVDNPEIDRLLLWEVPLGQEQASDGEEFLAALRETIAAGDREEVIRHFMRGMPPEWFDRYRSSPQWPEIERLAPALEADAEAMAWTQSRSRAELFSGISARTTALVGTSAYPFFRQAADSIVAAIRNADQQEVDSTDHSWDPLVLAEEIDHQLLGIGRTEDQMGAKR